jgi:hypothetical protein
MGEQRPTEGISVRKMRAIIVGLLSLAHQPINNDTKCYFVQILLKDHPPRDQLATNNVDIKSFSVLLYCQIIVVICCGEAHQ